MSRIVIAKNGAGHRCNAVSRRDHQRLLPTHRTHAFSLHVGLCIDPIGDRFGVTTGRPSIKPCVIRVDDHDTMLFELVNKPTHRVLDTTGLHAIRALRPPKACENQDIELDTGGRMRLEHLIGDF